MRKIILVMLFVTSSFLLLTHPASALTCTTITKTLSSGSENNEVLLLQQFLAENGYLKVAPNGYFGGNTKKSLIAFQRAQNLSGSGAVGPLTREKIRELSCATSSSQSKKVSDQAIASITSEKKIEVIETPSAVVMQDAPSIYIKTVMAKDITQDSATLLGSGGVDGEQHWFEWGTSMEMKNTTPPATTTRDYSYKITKLTPNTNYYFRAVTSVASTTTMKGATAYGDTRYFVTPPAAVVVKVPTPTVTITSTGLAVDAYGSVKITWDSTNTNTCLFTGGEEGGDWTKQVGLSGQYITRPLTKSALFGIVCKNNSNYTVTGSVTVAKPVK